MSTLKTSKAKENILRKIRNGLEQGKLPLPFPEADKDGLAGVFAGSDASVEETFASEFIKLGGKFIYCDHEQDLMDSLHSLYDHHGWQQLLCAEQRLLTLFHNNKLQFIQAADARAEGAEACITGCELLVARTGSILLSSRQHMGRIAPVFYPVHIVVAYASQIVADIPQGLQAMKHKYGAQLPSMINLNTGPSRTADIEKTLVVGVHGPKEVYCFFVNA